MDPDLEPESMKSVGSGWDKWEAAIEVELCLLYKREVFGPAVPTPPKVILIGCCWYILDAQINP